MLGLKLNHVSKRGHWQAPIHHLNQGWLIVKWSITNKRLVKFWLKYKYFHSRKNIWKCLLEKCCFVPASTCCYMTSIVFWVNSLRPSDVYLNLYITIIGSGNGLLPGWCQAIIWTNAGILLIGPPGTNFSEIFINIHTFSFKKIHLKMVSGKWRPFCLNVIIPLQTYSSVRSSVGRCTDQKLGIDLIYQSAWMIVSSDFEYISLIRQSYSRLAELWISSTL